MKIIIRDNWKAYFYAPLWVAKAIWNEIDKEKLWNFFEWCVVMTWIFSAFAAIILFIYLLRNHHWFLAGGWFWFGLGFWWFTLEFLDENFIDF